MKETLIELAIELLKQTNPDEELIYRKVNDHYIGTKIIDLFKYILSFGEFIESLKLKDNDTIAIISENRVEWIVSDIGSMLAKKINVPIYPTLTSESIKYILKDSNAKIVCVSTQLQLEKVLQVKDELPQLKYIIKYFNDDKVKDKLLIPIKNIFQGIKGYSKKELIEIFEKKSERINPEDVITIIYTSGTTGVPKGVMLTHKNIYSNLKACYKVLNIGPEDAFLSYLPYSHIYERTTGYYFPLFNRSKIYYAQSIDTIGLQMQEVKPTIVITVPRLLDKMYNKLNKSFEEMPSGAKKRLFKWALEVARNPKIKKTSFRWMLADKLVYKKIREKTGSRLKFFVSGGGALNKTIGEFFDRIGIVTLEGYGMTETSPVISVNRPEFNKYGTVGPPLDGVSVKIAPDGEILVKGDLVMKGYYNNPEETKKTIIDGWLHTGDIGEIDEDGHIKITDRKKSLFKSSGGKYIAPTHIEELILQIPYIEQVLIVGNERMYVTALIVLEQEGLKALARELNIKEEEDLFENPKIKNRIQIDINEKQKHLAPHEKIRKFTILKEAFTIENGELTPTLKIKRKFVEEKYKDLIDKMYHKV
ncbi:MAG: long-chain fatty acid--CoA ligase [Ignavibacteria bacterium]|nr:long-chain fatty acid--CoA ligase [Ignavibacteria bacterium]